MVTTPAVSQPRTSQSPLLGLGNSVCPTQPTCTTSFTASSPVHGHRPGISFLDDLVHENLDLANLSTDDLPSIAPEFLTALNELSLEDELSTSLL